MVTSADLPDINGVGWTKSIASGITAASRDLNARRARSRTTTSHALAGRVKKKVKVSLCGGWSRRRGRRRRRSRRRSKACKEESQSKFVPSLEQEKEQGVSRRKSE